MLRYTCLDSPCPDSKITKPAERRFFFYHVSKKPTNDLIKVLRKYKLVKYPEQLSRLTLVNVFVDFCIEPFASKIINEDVK